MILATIRDLAVREKNVMVARVANMQQDRDEPVCAFGARLRGHAGVCKFTIPGTGCGAEVNYADAMLRDVLCRGLGDPDIRLDLLSDKNQDMTLEQVFKFVEAKEAGKRSATHLLALQRSDALSKSTFLSGRSKSVKKGHAPHTTRNKQPGPGMKLAHTVGKEGMNAVC